MEELEAAASDVIDAALMLHRQIGPGLLESVYEMLLASELDRRGHRVLRQQPIDFGGETLREGVRRIINTHNSFAP